MSVSVVHPPESLAHALFGDPLPRIIAAVGGGGKTTFLKTMATELAERGKRVVITTTTKMRPPEDIALLGTTPEEVISLLKVHPIVWAGTPLSPEKMTKVPGLLPLLQGKADHILVEADGARHRPLKMTDPACEPVIPPSADAVVAVMGLDALGRPVGEAVHRPALACEVLGVSCDHPVTPADAAALLRHCYAPRYVLLNKADTPALESAAREVAAHLPEARCVITRLRDWGQAGDR